MLSINYIKNHTEQVIEKLKRRNIPDIEREIHQLVTLNTERLTQQQLVETHAAHLNQISKKIEENRRNKVPSDLKATMQKELKELKRNISQSKEKLKSLQGKLKALLEKLPNLPHETVPLGKTEADNIIVFTSTKEEQIQQKYQNHFDLVKVHDIVDFELGNKLAGSGFPVYKQKGAKLQRALIQFFLDEAINKGYLEIQPPILINEESAYATGHLPDKENMMYTIHNTPYYLLPTAELALMNLYRNQILTEEKLPIKHVAYTPCFRREAGSWGKKVRGLNRLHQFDKVEIIQVVKPENSYEVLEAMCDYVKTLLEKLALDYRIVKLCSGDLGFTSAMTYDFEVFAHGQKTWFEVSSISNCETYQTNRLKLKYKSKEKNKNEYPHTLNGSALALPRILLAILENNQDQNRIHIPSILHPYTGFEYIEKMRNFNI